MANPKWRKRGEKTHIVNAKKMAAAMANRRKIGWRMAAKTAWRRRHGENRRKASAGGGVSICSGYFVPYHYMQPRITITHCWRQPICTEIFWLNAVAEAASAHETLADVIVAWQ